MSAIVRTYRKGEELPQTLRTGFETAKCCNPDWIFIAERDGKPVGVLITAPAHAFVILLRLIMTEEAGEMDVLTLLVQTASFIKEREYQGYATWLDPTVQTEKSLLNVLIGHGGQALPNVQVACAGKV